MDERWDSCVADTMMDLCERLLRDWRDRRSECEVWAREAGSEDERSSRERVVRRFRYVDVIGSVGGGREDVSKASK